MTTSSSPRDREPESALERGCTLPRHGPRPTTSSSAPPSNSVGLLEAAGRRLSVSGVQEKSRGRAGTGRNGPRDHGAATERGRNFPEAFQGKSPERASAGQRRSGPARATAGQTPARAGAGHDEEDEGHDGATNPPSARGLERRCATPPRAPALANGEGARARAGVRSHGGSSMAPRGPRSDAGVAARDGGAPRDPAWSLGGATASACPAPDRGRAAGVLEEGADELNAPLPPRPMNFSRPLRPAAREVPRVGIARRPWLPPGRHATQRRGPPRRPSLPNLTSGRGTRCGGLRTTTNGRKPDPSREREGP